MPKRQGIKREGQIKAVEYLTSEEILQALQTLVASQGWKIVEEFVEEDLKRINQNIEEIEKDIFDEKSNLTATDIVKLKEKRLYQKELIKTHVINIPQLIITQIKQAIESKVEKPKLELNPYEKLNLTNPEQ